MTVRLHQGDLPDGLDLGSAVAIDTETLGLNPHRDRLCLVQLSRGDGDAELVQIVRGQKRAPNLERLLADPKVLKIFHFARFDLAVRFAYEWRDDSGQWYRSYGNENWEFTEAGLMRRRFASINDLPIKPEQRLFHWPLGRRPDDHPGLSELGL